MKLARRLFGALALAMGGFACTAVVGDGDYKVASCGIDVSAVSGSCESCFSSNCATQCGACSADGRCSGAWSCAMSCGADSSCTSACLSGLSSSSSTLLDATLTCLSNHCSAACGVQDAGAPDSGGSPPTGRGIGDACTDKSQCASGLCSNAGWCTATCSSSDAVCAGGHGSDGLQNEYGRVNWCILNSSNVDVCFPGCTTSADCAVYPGTTCHTTKDVTGLSVSICSQ